MKDTDKIKLLKSLLDDKEAFPEDKGDMECMPDKKGILTVKAEGKSPEQAKEKILEELKGIQLPDEEEMDNMSPKKEMGDEEEMDMPEEDNLDESMLEDEDREIMDMLPEKTKEAFKQKLLEKIKNL